MITTWSQGIGGENMDETILVDLRDRIRQHPWWHARARMTLGLLDRLDVQPPAWILDAGCGWGVTLEALERRGYRTTGLDISRRILEELDHEHRDLIEADLAQPVPGDPPCFD